MEVSDASLHDASVMEVVAHLEVAGEVAHPLSLFAANFGTAGMCLGSLRGAAWPLLLVLCCLSGCAFGAWLEFLSPASILPVRAMRSRAICSVAQPAQRKESESGFFGAEVTNGGRLKLPTWMKVWKKKLPQKKKKKYCLHLPRTILSYYTIDLALII